MVYPVYQVLARPRTGSHFINQMCWHFSGKNEVQNLEEFFDGAKDINSYNKKLDFLLEERDKGRHYCIKFMTYSIHNPEATLDFLKDYNVVLIKRNPWKSFLSRVYLYRLKSMYGFYPTHKNRRGEWIYNSTVVDVDEKELFALEIPKKDIIEYIDKTKKWIILLDWFEKRLPNLYVFDYDLDHDLQLQNIFPKYNKNYKLIYANTTPIEIDYEKHVINLEKTKLFFNEYLESPYFPQRNWCP